MSLSLGMTYIDQTGIVVALPKIQLLFKLSSVLLQWIVNAYLLALAVFMVLGGRLGDLFGHHKIFMIGIVIFLFSSIACAIAPNITLLIGGRSLQGIGGAFILSNAPVILINTFGIAERGRAMGIYIGIAVLFTPLGLIIAGFFTEYLSWRLIFWINFPLSLVCLWIEWQVKNIENLPHANEKIDWRGLITFTLAISTLVIALMETAQTGLLSAHVIILLACSFIFFTFCFYVEKGPHPIFDLSVFSNPLFLCAAILFFAMSISFGFFVFDIIFYQQVLGYSPTMSALLFLPYIICTLLAAPIAGRTLDKYGYYKPVIFGLILTTVGLFLKAFALPFQNYWYLLPAIILLNIGSPFITSSINTAALSSFDQYSRGKASGILNTIRQVSNTVILALLTILIIGANRYLLVSFLKKNQNNYPGLTLKQIENLLHHSPQLKFSADKMDRLYYVTKSAFASAYSLTVYICAVFIILVLLTIMTLLKRKILHNKEEDRELSTHHTE